MASMYREAAITLVDALGNTLLFERSTPGAFLTCISCVYLEYLPPRVRSFVDKHTDEGRPPDIMNGFGQEASRQTFDVEVFDGNHAEVVVVRLWEF